MKHRDDSKIKSFLAKTITPVPDPYSVAALFEDFKNAPKWMHMISEVTEINRISDSIRDVRLETRLPWPVKDRDTAVHATVTQDATTGDITIFMKQDDTLLEEFPGYIRMPEIQGTIQAKMLSKQRMYIEMEFLMDPGGYVPPWATNFILTDISYNTMKKLRKMLLREEYQEQRSAFESWISVPDSYYNNSYHRDDEVDILKELL